MERSRAGETFGWMGYRGSAGEEEEEERQEGGGRAEVADLVSGGEYELLYTLDCTCVESRVRRGPYAAPSLVSGDKDDTPRLARVQRLYAGRREFVSGTTSLLSAKRAG